MASAGSPADAAVAAAAAARCSWLRWFVCRRGRVHLLVERELRPAKRESPAWMNVHSRRATRPATRLVVAIAPGLTIGFVRPSALRSTAATRVERQAGGVDADACPRLLGAERLSQTRANTNGLDDAHDRELDVRVAGRRHARRSTPTTQIPKRSARLRAPAPGRPASSVPRCSTGSARAPQRREVRGRAPAGGSRPVETKAGSALSLDSRRVSTLRRRPRRAEVDNPIQGQR